MGQDLELVPQTNPSRARTQGTLTFQVLFKGKPLQRGAITAANRLNTVVRAQHLRTDANGLVTIEFDKTGDWFIGIVHMERTAEVGAEWRSYWASLTFHLE